MPIYLCEILGKKKAWLKRSVSANWVFENNWRDSKWNE